MNDIAISVEARISRKKLHRNSETRSCTPGRAVAAFPAGVGGAVRSVHQGDGVAGMHASGSGVGALDASEASQLREALFASACEVHHDAASVLGSAPPTNVLRPARAR